MRNLILLRGSAGVGKSTWIENNNLEQYTLSPDKLRLNFQSPVLTLNGGYGISQKNDSKVWKLLFELLEQRMERGEFTVIDATHTSTKSINAYRKLCDKYKYRCFVVDFSDISIEVALKQNKNRSPYKFVPEEAIKMMYSRFNTQKIPSFAKLISRDNFENEVKYTPMDLSNYNKIHFIGDIHGCLDPLQEYFKDGFKDDEFYVFLGDYTDRGLQNKEVLEWLVDVMKINKLNCEQPNNIIILEGNHERYTRMFAENNTSEIKSRIFLKETMQQLEGIDKKALRQLYRKLGQLAYIKYNEKEIIVTHGGVPFIPEDLIKVSTNEFINGVGKYEDNIGEYFRKNSKENQYCVYGHRNIQNYPVQVNEKAFNLQGDVEFGGHLRIITLNKDGFETVEIKNNTFKERTTPKKEKAIVPTTTDWVQQLRDSKFVTEKTFGNISSFNFNKKAWYKKEWNEQTIKARGLFVNINTSEIVARSYDKFFNIGENSKNSLGELKNNLKFPVTISLKENGYLGILGYDSELDEMVFASKSSLIGDYAERFKELFFKQFNIEQIARIKKYLQEQNSSFIFEVIDPIFDPHIIKYNNPKIVLLDVVKRQLEFENVDIIKLKQIAESINCESKKLEIILHSWGDFCEWYYPTEKDKSIELEGYVLQDANNFMTKIKLPYYKFWKKWRGFKEMMRKDKNINGRMLNTALDGKFYKFLKELNDEYLKLNIITLREMFYKKLDRK